MAKAQFAVIFGERFNKVMQAQCSNARPYTKFLIVPLSASELLFIARVTNTRVRPKLVRDLVICLRESGVGVGLELVGTVNLEQPADKLDILGELAFLNEKITPDHSLQPVVEERVRTGRRRPRVERPAEPAAFRVRPEIRCADGHWRDEAKAVIAVTSFAENLGVQPRIASQNRCLPPRLPYPRQEREITLGNGRFSRPPARGQHSRTHHSKLDGVRSQSNARTSGNVQSVVKVGGDQ